MNTQIYWRLCFVAHRSKTLRTFSSLWPINFANNSGPLTVIIRRFQQWDNCVTKFVFPVPGAPNNKTPAWFRNGLFSNIFGQLFCHINTSSNTLTAVSKPGKWSKSSSWPFSLCSATLFMMPCKQYVFVVFNDSVSTSFVSTGLVLSET